MNETLKKRIKSFIWRAGAMAFVAGGAYVLQVGDLWQLDVKMLVNISVIAGLGLVVSEITKYLNK